MYAGEIFSPHVWPTAYRVWFATPLDTTQNYYPACLAFVSTSGNHVSMGPAGGAKSKLATLPHVPRLLGPGEGGLFPSVVIFHKNPSVAAIVLFSPFVMLFPRFQDSDNALQFALSKILFTIQSRF